MKKHMIGIRLTCLLLCLILPCTALADLTPEQRLANAFRVFSGMGGSVAVIENGQVTYTYTCGVQRLGGESVTPDTLFQVGSISKMVACIGLMQLVEQKNIPLDTPLGDLLGMELAHPEFPRTPITLRQLMTHTASLRDCSIYDRAISGRVTPLSSLFSQHQQEIFIPKVKPGTQRLYCNFGGGLIGVLIEKLSGETVDEYMQKHVFGPLDITAAYHVNALPQDAPLADIYHMPQKYLGRILRDDPTVISAPDPESHYVLTAGKLMISAPDLAKILIVLCDGGIYQNTRLLRESTVDEMLTPQNFRGSVDCQTGNGLFLNIVTDDQAEGRTMYGHGGRANGMLCCAYFDPTDRTGVVMLNNGCRSGVMHNNVGMLGRVVTSLCYRYIINPTHQRQDPFEVE